MLRTEEQQEGRTWVLDDDTQLTISSLPISFPTGKKKIFSLLYKLP